RRYSFPSGELADGRKVHRHAVLPGNVIGLLLLGLRICHLLVPAIRWYDAAASLPDVLEELRGGRCLDAGIDRRRALALRPVRSITRRHRSEPQTDAVLGACKHRSAGRDVVPIDRRRLHAAEQRHAQSYRVDVVPGDTVLSKATTHFAGLHASAPRPGEGKS